MKKLFKALVAVVAVGGAVGCSGCGAANSTVSKWLDFGLSAEEYACALATEATDNATVAEVCKIADQYAPALESILKAKLAGKAAKADAGAPAAPPAGSK